MILISSSIRSVFNGIDDSYDPSRHQLVANVNPGQTLRNAYSSGIPVVKREATVATLNLLEYIDLNTGERNGLVTARGLGQITGHRLKFEPSDPQQGIFFIATDGTENRVDIVGQNKPSNLFLGVPALSSGDSTLEVRA